MITIIVLLILAGVSLNAIIGENGIVTSATDASIMYKFSTYNEELETNAVEDMEIYAVSDNMKNYIPSMKDIDKENFIILRSKLIYIGTNEYEIEILKRLGIDIADLGTSDVESVREEIKAITEGVINVSDENREKIPNSDSDRIDELEHTDTSEGLIGTRLYSRENNLVNRRWNIVIEYNSEIIETERYGSGYYLLEKGKCYTIKGKTLEFKNNYVINYTEGIYVLLSERAVNWNEKTTLGVSEGLILNLDPMALSTGEWRETNEKDEISENFYEKFYVKDSLNGVLTETDYEKVGDVKYNRDRNALEFNESDSGTGKGGYLKAKTKDAKFENGFTIELYFNPSRLSYKDYGITRYGLFCRRVSLTEGALGCLKCRGWN